MGARIANSSEGAVVRSSQADPNTGNLDHLELTSSELVGSGQSMSSHRQTHQSETESQWRWSTKRTQTVAKFAILLLRLTYGSHSARHASWHLGCYQDCSMSDHRAVLRPLLVFTERVASDARARGAICLDEHLGRCETSRGPHPVSAYNRAIESPLTPRPQQQLHRDRRCS
jgi:hypothetical protein